MPNRVQAEPANSATPATADNTRLRWPAAAADRARRSQHLAGPHQLPRGALVERFGGQPHGRLPQVLGHQVQHCTAHRQPARRPGVAQRRTDQTQSARSRRGRADEHERQLAVALVPARRSGVGEQHGGIRGDGRSQQRSAQTSRPARRSGQLADRSRQLGQQLDDLDRSGEAGQWTVCGEDPGTDRHR